MRKSAWRRIQYGEVILFKLAIFFIGLLVFTQALLFGDHVRPYLSRVDQFEGTQILFQLPLYAAKPLQISDTAEAGRLESLRNSKVIIIRMISPANNHQVFVTVNGKVIDDFRKGSMKLTVYDGDYVEIDARRQSAAVQFVVNVPGASLLAPPDGLALEGGGAMLPVGRVKFKN